MTTPRHHTEWLGLVEQSGPFLSLPVLPRVFPQGLDTVDSEVRRRLAQALAEWLASLDAGRPDPVLQQAWIRFVLEEVLELPEAALLRDQSLPRALQMNRTEEGEVLRPDLALVGPSTNPTAAASAEPNSSGDLFGDECSAPAVSSAPAGEVEGAAPAPEARRTHTC